MTDHDELAAAVRTAADAVPPHGGDLDAVRARARARRRRSTVAVGAAAVAVAAAIAVPATLAATPGHAPAPAAGASSSPAEPDRAAQRLLIDARGGWAGVLVEDGVELEGAATGESTREAYERYRRQPDATGVFGGFAEVRPDGEAVDLDLALPEVEAVRELVPLPDGRLVLIGTVDRMPGVERTDGPCVEGVDFPLLVLGADGSVGLTRQVRVPCQRLALVGADADTAYLLRDSALVAHDLATGDERTLLDSTELFGSGARVALGSDRVVTATREWAAPEVGCQPGDGGPGTVVRAAEVATGEHTEHSLAGGG